MKGRLFRICALLTLCALLAGCAKGGAGKGALSGTYTAVDPPVDSGETVIESVEFNGDEVTMRGGELEQTVHYKVEGDSFTLLTDFGDFEYDFEQREDGTLVIDGIDYVKADR